MVRVDNYVSKAIAKNITDVYLPDDTHFSFKGYDLVSMAVCENLVDHSVISFSKNIKDKANCAVQFNLNS